MPDLTERLAATRTRLLDEIDVPDLGVIGRRAAALRRRRLAARSGGALLALVTAGTLVAQTGAGTAPRPPVAATATPDPASVLVFTGAGITVHGLSGVAAELPGQLRDIEFVDPYTGWALATDCPVDATTCQLTVARTADGGLTWSARPVAGYGTGPENVPDLAALDARTLVLHGAGKWMVSTDSGVTWKSGTAGGPADGPGATLERDARPLLRPGGGAGCAGTVVEVFATGDGYRGDLANPPPLDVCWVSVRPAADGGWWVGGTEPGTGRAAVAVTRDGGTTWHATFLDAPGDSARVATLGDHTYVAVVAGRGDATELRAVYHSARPDAAFTRTWTGGPQPRTIGGDPVPLLDGRLLLVDGDRHWFVSRDDGRSFARVAELPRVIRLSRTPAGYVAFGIVADAYAAFSSDGSTWRKLHAR